MDPNTEKLFAELQRIASTADDRSKRRTIDRLRQLQYSLETPEETMQRLMYGNLTIASVRVSLNLEIFDLLAEASEPLSITEIAEQTGADPVLLGRILRHQASIGVIQEASQDAFTANTTTRHLCVPEIQAGIVFSNNVLGPAFQMLPEYLAERDHQNPTELGDSPFQRAWKTDLPLWSWLSRQPQMEEEYDRFTFGQRASIRNCFSLLPIDEECSMWPDDRAVFVDVGGGDGQQCAALKAMFPNLPGKVILQDLSPVIAGAQLPVGVMPMVYDFFTPQPVKGARYYYFRAVMHYHTDDKCLEILRNVVGAMTKDSILLIDEVVVPSKDASWFVTQNDLAKMVQFSSMDRTEEQWRQLLTRAGFVIRNFTTYHRAFGLSVIAATK